MRRFLKIRLQPAIWPAIFLGITAYFGDNAMHGKSGLDAQRVERAQLATALTTLAQVDAQRSVWEIRVADLSTQSIGPDMLDNQARKVLNLANPDELVIPLSPPEPRNK